MTPHNRAAKGEIAKRVLLPGDPNRAAWVAKNFLEESQEVTNVRGMLGFTGLYKGEKISVMGSGMGGPSAESIAMSSSPPMKSRRLLGLVLVEAFNPTLKLAI